MCWSLFVYFLLNSVFVIFTSLLINSYANIEHVDFLIDKTRKLGVTLLQKQIQLKLKYMNT
jgi:hypothetical protein